MLLALLRTALLMFICASAFAAENHRSNKTPQVKTSSLERYLNQANHQGFKIIYSTDLIRSDYQVTFDANQAITVEKLRHVLAFYKLNLEVVASNQFLVVLAPQTKPIAPAKPPIQTLPFTAAAIEEIVVTSSSYRLFIQNTPSNSKLEHNTLVKRPALGNDILHQVNQLPGAASVGLSVRPRVRGGGEDETLIQFDGMQLYDPFHFLSLFGSFDARVVESIDFYAGGYAANYGDKLSAVMSINPRQLVELDNYQELGLGLYNASYFYKGGRGDHHYLVNARRSTINIITGLAESDLGQPSFTDFYARYEWDKNEDTQLSANLFWFGDDLEINTPSGQESSEQISGNIYLWLNLRSDITEALSVTSLFGLSRIREDREGAVSKPNLVSGKLDEENQFSSINLKQDYQWLPNNRQLLKLGWDYKYLKVNYDFSSFLTVDAKFQDLSNLSRPATLNLERDLHGQQFAAYIDLKHLVNQQFSLSLGLRLDTQDYISAGNKSDLSPRLALQYRLSETTDLKLGWGRFSQSEGLHELKVNDGVLDFQPRQTSEQLILGLEHRLNNGGRLRLETYRKRGNRISTYFENLTTPLSLAPELQPDRISVSPRHSTARGIELSYSQQTDRFDFWGNYSYAQVRDHFGNHAADSEIKRSWDQTHSANLGMTTNLGQWQLSFSGSFHSGWATTALRLENSLVSADKRNRDKLKNYHSWALKLTREWQFKQQSIRVELGLSNLFDHDNQVGVDYELEGDSLDQLIATKKFGIPRAPIFDLYWRF